MIISVLFGMILMDSGEITLIQHAHTLSHMSGSIYCINVKKYKKFRGQDVRKRGQDILPSSLVLILKFEKIKILK